MLKRHHQRQLHLAGASARFRGERRRSPCKRDGRVLSVRSPCPHERSRSMQAKARRIAIARMRRVGNSIRENSPSPYWRPGPLGSNCLQLRRKKVRGASVAPATFDSWFSLRTCREGRNGEVSANALAIAPCYPPHTSQPATEAAVAGRLDCAFLVHHGRKRRPVATGMVRPPTNTSTTRPSAARDARRVSRLGRSISIPCSSSISAPLFASP